MPPTMLINSLESIRRRVRTLSVVFGIGVVASAEEREFVEEVGRVVGILNSV